MRAVGAAPAVPAAELLAEVRAVPRRPDRIGRVGTGRRLLLGPQAPPRHRRAGRSGRPSPAALGCFTRPVAALRPRSPSLEPGRAAAERHAPPLAPLTLTRPGQGPARASRGPPGLGSRCGVRGPEPDLVSLRHRPPRLALDRFAQAAQPERRQEGISSRLGGDCVCGTEWGTAVTQEALPRRPRAVRGEPLLPSACFLGDCCR